jgi:hypothetical protein
MPAPMHMQGARSTVLGSLLVTLVLMDMPSFWAPSPAATAAVGAGGGWWHPSGDPNALRGGDSKLKATVLICIEADAKICFGVVGTRRFCWSLGCKVKSHASKKFKMGCNAGWFLASKPQMLTGTPTTFITPFLDTSRITEDTREVLMNTLDHKTTEEWEEFIAEANEEWEEVQAQCPLEEIKEQLSGALGDEDSATAEGDL